MVTFLFAAFFPTLCFCYYYYFSVDFRMVEKININVSGAYFNSVKLPASGPQFSVFSIPF